MHTRILLLLTLSMLIYGCSSSSNATDGPENPTDLKGTVASNSQVNLFWTDNSSDETGFKIERKTGTGSYATVGMVNADVVLYSDLGLTPNTNYTYRVCSNNSEGDSTYSNEITLTTSNLPTGSDIDGNTFSLVTICSQTWMKTNLNVSRYRNGDVIPQVTNQTEWNGLTTGAWCYYNHDSANGPVYGKLYNWYAVNDPRGLAPVGYHIPSDTEWTALTNCVEGQNGGGALKHAGTIYWVAPNEGATNSSGFTGLGAGSRFNFEQFDRMGYDARWWSSTQHSGLYAYYFTLHWNNGEADMYSGFKTYGQSVRCIKD